MTPSTQEWKHPPPHLTLTPAEVHVWRASLDGTPTQRDTLYATLADDERQRAGRFRADRDRHHYIVARGILRALLGLYLQRHPSHLHFSYNPYGKPALSSHYAPTALQFNLSHSGQLVLYVFAYSRELGIDIELIRPDFARDQIAAQFFSPQEYTMLQTLPPAQRTIGFFNCWTRKEAYVKARGQGLSLPLDQFDVSLVPGEPAALLQTRDRPDETTRWSLRNLLPGPGYIAALAVEGTPAWQLCAWQWPESATALT